MWPDPVTDLQRDAVAEPARRIVELRHEICGAEQIGLTTLYNRVDDGAYRDLAEAHTALDEAVVAAYGWPAKIASDRPDLVSRLEALNAEITSGARTYAPFPSAPGEPENPTLGI